MRLPSAFDAASRGLNESRRELDLPSFLFAHHQVIIDPSLSFLLPFKQIASFYNMFVISLESGNYNIMKRKYLQSNPFPFKTFPESDVYSF